MLRSRKSYRAGSRRSRGGKRVTTRNLLSLLARYQKRKQLGHYGQVLVRDPKDKEWTVMERGPITKTRFGGSWKTATMAQRAARRNWRMTGRGLYRGKGGYWGRLLGGLVGQADLGDRLGDMAGSAIRAAGGGTLMDAASAAGRVFAGRGAYEEANQLIDGGSDQVPSFAPSVDGASVVISHKEYVCDVYGPESLFFENTQFPINPGLERTFPWLSQIAQNYDEYEIKQLIFTYKSQVGEFTSPTGQVGTVIMATQYDVNDEEFTDKQQMLGYDSAMSSKATNNQLHGVECDPMKLSGATGKYVRVGPPPIQAAGGGAADLKSYDHATFNIAVAAIPEAFRNQAIGELHVSYTVELRKPKFFTARGYGITRDVWTMVTPFNESLLSNVATPWVAPVGPGCGNLHGQQNTLGASVGVDPSDASKLVVTLPATYQGNLEVKLFCQGAPGFGIHGDHSLSEENLPCSVAGSVSHISDIVHSQGWTWYNQVTLPSISGSGAVKEMVMITAHLRVQNPAAVIPPVDNQIVFQFDSTAPESALWTWTLELSDYNAGFNFKQDGTNDKMVLVDKTESPVDV